MMGIFFPDYVEVIAPAGDPERAKWDAVKNEVAGVTSSMLIETVNIEVNNRIRYLSDPGDDHWQSPAETCETLTGDCEDYAILKRAILIKSGVPKERLAVVLCRIVSPVFVEHAFLVLEMDGGRRVVLDNRFYELLDPKDYVGMTPLKLLTANEVYLYLRAFRISDVAQKEAPA